MSSNLRATFANAWERASGQRNDGGDAPDWRPGATVIAVFADLDAWRPWLPQALVLLDAAEQQRMQRKHRHADRDDLALAYALHRLVLGNVLAQQPDSVALLRAASGRPYLQDEVVQTSLSHADGHVAVAVARHGPVGIDLELASRAAGMPEIAAHVCHPDEARALQDVSDAALGTALLHLWVRKEALLKAAGIGLSREMRTLQAPPDRPLPLPLAVGDDDGQRVTIRMLDVPAHLVAALASDDDGPVQAIWLPPPQR